MNKIKKLSVLEKASLILALALMLCLFQMPYGLYTVIRLATAIIACCWAYQFFEMNKTPWAIISIGIAILFQPLTKIALDRTTWNILDVFIAILIIGIIFFRNRQLLTDKAQ